VQATAKSEHDLHSFGVPLGAHLIPRPWQKSQAFAALRRFLGSASPMVVCDDRVMKRYGANIFYVTTTKD
jgi:hypothetical protein